jgi:hypothetical protein
MVRPRMMRNTAGAFTNTTDTKMFKRFGSIWKTPSGSALKASPE